MENVKLIQIADVAEMLEDCMMIYPSFAREVKDEDHFKRMVKTWFKYLEGYGHIQITKKFDAHIKNSNRMMTLGDLIAGAYKPTMYTEEELQNIEDQRRVPGADEE